jgi:hypothetical protein
MISVVATHLPPPNPSPLRILILDDTAFDAALAVAAPEEAPVAFVTGSGCHERKRDESDFC